MPLTGRIHGIEEEKVIRSCTSLDFSRAQKKAVSSSKNAKNVQSLSVNQV